MTLNQATENTGEIPGTGPAGGFCLDSGRKGRLMTTYDDFFGAAFGKFQVKSMDYGEKGDRK